MLKQIRYFQSVVQLGSFTDAANEHFISQLAISQQIRALEAELGVVLLVRKKRSFTLTAAGKYFIKRAWYLLRITTLSVVKLSVLQGKAASTSVR